RRSVRSGADDGNDIPTVCAGVRTTRPPPHLPFVCGARALGLSSRELGLSPWPTVRWIEVRFQELCPPEPEARGEGPCRRGFVPLSRRRGGKVPAAVAKRRREVGGSRSHQRSLTREKWIY